MKDFWTGFQKEAEENKKETHYGKGALIGAAGGYGITHAIGDLSDRIDLKKTEEKLRKQYKHVPEKSIKVMARRADMLGPKFNKKLTREVATHMGGAGAIAGLGVAGLHHLYSKIKKED
jgi:hypothetical protein